MQATWAIGKQEFLLFIGLPLDSCDEVFSRVPDPNLIVVVRFFNTCAERRTMACSQSGQDFRHVIDSEFVGEPLQTLGLIQLKRDAGDRQPIKQHILNFKSFLRTISDGFGLAQMSIHLLQRHSPGQAFHTG